MTTADIETFLRDKAVRPTANRILVIRQLLDATHPVSMAELEESFDFSLDRASIFRVVELFVEKEIVHAIEDGSRSVKYELCRGGAHHSVADQHVHFYCERCKETYCLEDISVPLISVPDGFRPHSVNYMIKGVCPHCSEE